jgi:hypothetical protein
MRASEKCYGPERVPNISYGVLRHIPYIRNSSDAFMKQRRHKNPLDGVDEIRNTIRWVIKAVRLTPCSCLNNALNIL